MPAILPILSGLWSFATSTIGMVIIAAAVAFSSGHHRASVACAKREAAARSAAVLARQVEATRQARAAESIALRDIPRRASDAKADAAMAAEIDRLQLKRETSHATPGPKIAPPDNCRLDSDFVRRVRQLRKAGNS